MMPLINAGFNRVSSNMCVNLCMCVLPPVFEVFLCFMKFLDISNVNTHFKAVNPFCLRFLETYTLSE